MGSDDLTTWKKMAFERENTHCWVMIVMFTIVHCGDFGNVWCLVWSAQRVLRLACLLRLISGINILRCRISFFLWWLSTIVDCSGQFLAAILSIFVPPPSCILNHCSPLIHMIFVQEQQGMNVSYHTKTWIEFGCPMVSTKNHVLWKKHMSIVDLQVWNFDGEPTWLQKAA
jgi:hypothetical protein